MEDTCHVCPNLKRHNKALISITLASGLGIMDENFIDKISLTQAVFRACQLGQLDELRHHLGNGFSINDTDSDDHTALQVASANDQVTSFHYHLCFI